MNIGSLKDESEEKKMTTSKGLSVTILKQTHSAKSGCLTYEADVTRMLNVNTRDTYDNYDMYTLTCFYVCATCTNDV